LVLDHIFPDAVEDDNGVMHAVAGDRQNTGDEQQVDLDTYKPARMEKMPPPLRYRAAEQ